MNIHHVLFLALYYSFILINGQQPLYSSISNDLEEPLLDTSPSEIAQVTLYINYYDSRPLKSRYSSSNGVYYYSEERSTMTLLMNTPYVPVLSQFAPAVLATNKIVQLPTLPTDYIPYFDSTTGLQDSIKKHQTFSIATVDSRSVLAFDKTGEPIYTNEPQQRGNILVQQLNEERSKRILAYGETPTRLIRIFEHHFMGSILETDRMACETYKRNGWEVCQDDVPIPPSEKLVTTIWDGEMVVVNPKSETGAVFSKEHLKWMKLPSLSSLDGTAVSMYEDLDGVLHAVTVKNYNNGDALEVNTYQLKRTGEAQKIMNRMRGASSADRAFEYLKTSLEDYHYWMQVGSERQVSSSSSLYIPIGTIPLQILTGSKRGYKPPSESDVLARDYYHLQV